VGAQKIRALLGISAVKVRLMMFQMKIRNLMGIIGLVILYSAFW
jgi:hypothetical protein